jgi:hypothetical protein
MADASQAPKGADQQTNPAGDIADEIKNRVLEQIAEELRSQEHQGMMRRGYYTKNDENGTYTKYDK